MEAKPQERLFISDSLKTRISEKELAAQLSGEKDASVAVDIQKLCCQLTLNNDFVVSGCTFISYSKDAGAEKAVETLELKFEREYLFAMLDNEIKFVDIALSTLQEKRFAVQHTAYSCMTLLADKQILLKLSFC
jgi:hypothetical protein